MEQWTLKISKEKHICVVGWFDNFAVTLASSFTGVEPIDYDRRWSVAEKKFVMICRLACVQVYNEFMGGVDKLEFNLLLPHKKQN